MVTWRFLFWLPLLWVGCALAGAAPLPRPIFYLPLDGGTRAALAGGSPSPRTAGESDPILTLANLNRTRFSPGKVGLCCDMSVSPLVYRCAGNFRPDEGACSFWLNPGFRGDDLARYCAFFGAADWGMLYKYTNQPSLTFGTARPDRDIYYDCGVRDIRAWRPGEWHHLAVTWSRRENSRRIYVDGKPAAQGPFPFHRAVKDGPLFIGSGCTLYSGHLADSRMDEVAIWDQPLDDAAVAAAYALGAAGKPLWGAPAAPAGPEGDAAARLPVIRVQAPPPSHEVVTSPQRTRTRTTIPLDGWWAFLPAEEPGSAAGSPPLPSQGGGRSRVPGYWTSGDDTLGPDGQPTHGTWQGRALSEFSVGYYQRTFQADPAWRARSVFLQLGGVDGLADVFLNGRRLGRLPCWEDEAYDVTAGLRYGEENVLTLALATREGSRGAGIYGHVTLQVLPRAFVHDVVVRPSVTRKEIVFSCDVRSAIQAADARLELEVAPASRPDAPVKRFSLPCRLRPAPEGDAALSAQAQRVEGTFAWSDAHLWSYDDPYLYQVRVRLRLGGALADETPVYRFGFRELTRRGADFLLNGKPTHLRGHQIDLGWNDQMPHVRELREAGLNCFELSGPTTHDWYAGAPYREREFEAMLDYADTHGLIAIPLLPDATALRDHLFDPAVAKLYRRRLEKHIRRYGNHPSVGMWFMHFNLAGYPWYIAPSKIDGSYKPSEEGFRAKERYALEAQRIAQSIDPRPIYHHACGNFGDIFTANCYLGPNIPLQEREEWPSRWAEKRPFPLVAVEHCLMLIPYWFRVRRFPLSEVYASEPIFDEIAAGFLGPRAYDSITPKLFDLYDTDRPVRGSRLHALIQQHPGYQEVKSLVAARSLRAWRTYGVSGIIFNAENWDFRDEAGKPLPVMKAMARYFGDTDLYIAGPAGNWPSKDHAFFSGERIRKQVVLLNDLTRDLPVKLAWRLQGAGGRTYAEGQIHAVSRAGTPSFYPVEAVAPKVSERQSLKLVVEVLSQRGKHFLPESFALQVFPRAPSPAPGGRILVFDPAGETTKMLGSADLRCEPLTENSDLSHAALVVVGKRCWGDAFLSLARKLDLEGAVYGGLNLLVFEQAGGSPFGLKLEEQSVRQAFRMYGASAGLQDEDFADLRGESDLVPPYPDAAPETQRQWPERFWKWGNRGVLATYVAARPHYGLFAPILECGFDLAYSPLLQAGFGHGRAVLCQIDVTSRYGTDPVSTRIVDSLLNHLGQRGADPAPRCACVGESAKAFLRPFGIVPDVSEPGSAGVVVVGTEPVDAAGITSLENAARRGAKILFLPNAPAAEALGLQVKEERLFAGHSDAPLAGLTEGDLFLKRWTTLRAGVGGNGWKVLIEPGLLCEKGAGAGRLLACQLDPSALGKTRARIKALRLWNALLTNYGGFNTGPFLQPDRPLYEENEWETIPPYMNW